MNTNAPCNPAVLNFTRFIFIHFSAAILYLNCVRGKAG